MANCSNLLNTQSVSLTSGTLTAGFCHTNLQTTYEEFISKTTAAIAAGGTTNIASFTAGDDTPVAGDQGKLWFKQNPSDCNAPFGWYHYNAGASPAAWEIVPVLNDALPTQSGFTAGTFNNANVTVNNRGVVTGVTAGAETSPFHFITRSTLASGTGSVSATSVDISSAVSSAASTMGVTPTVAIVELYATVSSSPTGTASLLLKVGDDASMSHFAYVNAQNTNGSRNDAANTASPTNQATVPIGGSSGSEALYYSSAVSGGMGQSWKAELVGFIK
jgi:hypothetical protein